MCVCWHVGVSECVCLNQFSFFHNRHTPSSTYVGVCLYYMYVILRECVHGARPSYHTRTTEYQGLAKL